MIKVGILTASDKGYQGQREDLSGKLISEMIGKIFDESGESCVVVDYVIVPDDRKTIAENLVRMADRLCTDLILTTGGTGFSPRDVTPEATLDVIERHVPGIPEAMRLKSLEINNRAMLSRATSGIRGRTLIVNLPGSPKGVRECLAVILPVLPHAIEILKGKAGECSVSDPQP